MTDTIDLLESIGKDASLRHASSDQLAHALDQMDASDTLKQAVASGESTALKNELAPNDLELVHAPPGPQPPASKRHDRQVPLPPPVNA